MLDLMILIFPAVETSLESVAMHDAHVIGQRPQSGFFILWQAIGAIWKIESLLSLFDSIGQQSIILLVAFWFAAK